MSEDRVEFLDALPVEETETVDDQPLAEETAAEVAPETPEPKTEAEEDEHKEKRKGGYQRRIERLEKQNQELLELLKRGEAPKAPPQPEAASDKPNPDAFGTHAEFLEALTDWKVDQREKAREAEAHERKAKETSQTHEQAFNAKLQQAAETHADFNDLFEENAEDIPATPTMAQAVVESELGAELLYYFLSNPQEAKRIAGLPPIAAAMAIGKIEAKLAKDEAKPEPKPKTTQAPRPPSPVKSAPVTPKADDGKVDFY